jgi:hypothetical protein
MAGYGASPGERRGGRVAGVKNKATIERETLISGAIGELSRPLGKDVLAEVMMIPIIATPRPAGPMSAPAA